MRQLFAALRIGAGAAVLAFGAGRAGAAEPQVPAYVSAAVADASRTDADRQRDARRKPAEVLTFAGIRPGDRVGELMAGGGYYTRLLCKLVGAQGHVYTLALEPTSKMGPPPQRPGGAQPADKPAGEPCTNVTADTRPAAQPTLPAGLDAVWTSENYHDLHNDMFGKPDMVAFDKAILAALKPGGVFIVEDHAAAAGSGARDTGTLHRIDPELVKKEAIAAGFTLDAGSSVLANPEDPHTEAVFKLDGRSDKLLLKFRKPAR